MNTDLEADVAVVGAGILGCMIAREIAARAPGSSVVVVDRDAAGCGASRRSAGLHIPRGNTDRLRRMTEYSQEHYEKLTRAHPELPIRPLGMCVVAERSSATRLAESYLEHAGLTRLDRSGWPPVDVPGDAGVWRVHGGQHADVYVLTRALAVLLRGQVDFLEGVRVVDLDHSAGAVVLNLSTGSVLRARRVVLAPGPWLHEPAWRRLVAPLGARVKKIVALHLERRPAETDRAVVFQDEDAFLLPLPDRGHWLFSYTCQDWDTDPDAAAGGLSARDADAAFASLARHVPDVRRENVSGRVFCDAYSRAGEPLVQPLDAEERIVFAGAANGCGYRLAPAIAAETADLLRMRTS